MKYLVIEVRGGVVQDVYTDEKIRVVLVDWDEFEDSPEACAGELRPCSLGAMPEETEKQVNRLKS